jgi:hypothetical protein
VMPDRDPASPRSRDVMPGCSPASPEGNTVRATRDPCWREVVEPAFAAEGETLGRRRPRPLGPFQEASHVDREAGTDDLLSAYLVSDRTRFDGESSAHSLLQHHALTGTLNLRILRKPS